MGFGWGRKDAPRVLDVGCGDGRYLLQAARSRPDRDHLGIDLLRPLVDRAARRAGEEGLTNVRFVAGDAVAYLFEKVAADSVDEIHVYHPQPYYDPGQAALGMLTPRFFERLWTVLRPAGVLVLQTDNRPYGRYLLEAAQKHFEVRVVPEPWSDAPEGRTSRERVARRKKLRILRVVARRREAPLPISSPAPFFDTPRRPLRRR